MPRKRRSKYSVYLEMPDVKRWHTNLARGSPITAEVALRRLSRMCELLDLTPRGIVDTAKRDMKGYWNKPEETAKVFSKGWLCTGDLGYMDEDGIFYFVDRLKDVIKVSGFQVWPMEVEDVLCSHPAVLEVAVVGMPHAYHGEVPKAYVVLRSSYKGKVTEDELIKYCEEKLAKYKAPKKVEFVEDLPKTPSGKILRRELR